jgi:hypothetical protein
LTAGQPDPPYNGRALSKNFKEVEKLKIVISLSKVKKPVHHALWMEISGAKLYIFSIVVR